MLKRIPSGSLRLGMYIHAPEGSWMDYPNWKTRFLLTDQAELDEMRSSGVRAFFIDTGQGADVLTAEPQPEPVATARVKQPVVLGPPVASCTAEEEFGRAEAIVAKAKQGVGLILKQARLGKAIDLGRTVPVIEDITSSINRHPSALVSFLRMKSLDEYGYLHSVAVCALMINLGRQLLFDDETCSELGLAGLLMDIGKVALPAELLGKPGPLSPAETAQMRQHPVRGCELLSKSKDIPEVALDVCLHHHERFDGRGYGHGRRGEGISLPARMAAVCDVYDAITSPRPYKGAAEPAEAISEMFQAQGQFDESVLTAFIRSVGIYPIGSLVRLRSGRLGVVVEQNESELTKPRVRAFYSIARRCRTPNEDIDLSTPGEDEILSREKPEKWGFVSWDRVWPQILRPDMQRIFKAA